uniref:N-acetyltransferase domain-containing protein n=2 Tax=Apteryx TaxID=8821 RepID=A0A8B9SEP8_APTOW
MSEYVPSLCLHVLKQPWVVLLLACTFCLLLASSRSLLLPVLALTLLLAVGRQLLGSCWSAYIERCLADDLRDIRATYMQSARSRFWVAEADDRVVGTAAVLPARAGRRELALKRVSVRKDYRGLGIATALCRTAVAFARQQQGCGALVLNTLMVQREARGLYERLGFRRDRRYVLPTLYGRLANCTVTEYRYELPAPR